MKPSEVLKKARQWLSDPVHWTQGELWRDQDLKYMDLNSPKYLVSCTCAIGAIALVQDDPWDSGLPEKYLEAASLAQSGQSVTDFNDAPSTTHADVLALLDRVIELAEGKND